MVFAEAIPPSGVRRPKVRWSELARFLNLGPTY